MFYSQFILAKKGPLGTIWIAAHLERKLRKNQVADTDIGVSVDSILCPDVPIALRLSSHLLLGVVRIYSRKVNYLFHDCSEALLKVKQAFRSTAVDLPPEESTAPYHSITLPETFHLDDFELPDSAFQGDFVDHHVSTKEQITLQDTIDGAAFSTAQFGLDERFGDDNASHIGLDLDEELFLAKHSSPQHCSIILGIDECAGNQGQSSSSLHVTKMDVDDDQNEFVKNTDAEASEDLSNPNNDYNYSLSAIEETKKNDLSSNCQGYNIQTPDLNEAFFPNDRTEGIATSPSGLASIADDTPSNLVESAHVPLTPGLLEETFPANIHQSPALSPQRKFSPSAAEETLKSDNCSLLSECPDSMTANDPLHVETFVPGSSNAMQSDLSQQTEQPPIPDETQMECRQMNVDNVDDKLICTEMSVRPVYHQDHVEGEILLPENTQMEGAKHGAFNNRVPLDESLDNAEATPETFNSINTSGNQAHASKALSSAVISDFNLRPCTSKGNIGDELSAEDGTLFQNTSEGPTMEHGVQSEVPITEKAVDGGEILVEVQGKDSCVENAMAARMHESGYRLTTDVPSTSEFLEPEKMLLAPAGNVDLVNELSQVTAEKGGTESDGSNRISSLSGKKRGVLENSSVLENDSSVKLAGRLRVRRSSEHIPDDDDLLSSILVTKRTPGLRVGPTPPTKSVSLKRPRLMSSLGMTKRKVLVDDTTVLHADAIRQQLINTEDIRRIRKKAPCTRPEIWLIQKSYLEDEVFDEPIFAGISDELNCLHNRKYDSEFIVSVNENEKPELASTVPTNAEGEIHGVSRTPVSLEALNNKGRGEFGSQELLQSESSLFPLDNEHNTIDGSNRPVLSAASGECGHAVTDGVSYDAVPFADSSDFHAETVNGLDQTNDELSEIKDSKPKGTDASLNLYGPPKVSLAPTVDSDVLISTINNNLDEGEALMVTDMSSIFLNSNSPMGGVIGSGEATDLVAASGHKVSDREVSLDTEMLMENAEEKCFDRENSIPGLADSGAPENISISLSEQNVENGQILSAIGETSGLQEFNGDGDVVVESTAMDLIIGRDTSDFCSAIDGNDTEFLNVDDEAEYEESVNDMPSNDDVQSLENSGWSSRTRGVARYLKILFDEEAGHARKNVAMDHLIAGKSRKEASRMFFETLVLKTKDFIHVEQESPYGFITVKPRGKLLKSEF